MRSPGGFLNSRLVRGSRPEQALTIERESFFGCGALEIGRDGGLRAPNPAILGGRFWIHLPSTMILCASRGTMRPEEAQDTGSNDLSGQAGPDHN